MPLNTICPECDKNYTLADTMEGKTVKCKGCGNPFKVAAASVSNAVAAKPSFFKLEAQLPKLAFVAWARICTVPCPTITTRSSRFASLTARSAPIPN